MNSKVSRTIRIGVTGTSKINDKNSVNEKVIEILLKIDNILSKTPYQLIVVSPLAQGADQIVTNTILEFKGSSKYLKSELEIISQEKLDDENSDELSKFIDLSSSKRTLNDVLNDDIYNGITNDYTHAGQLVVDKCDCLIAVWDEEKSKNGDTSNIVNYARLNSIPVFIVNPNKSDEINEINTGPFWDDLEYLNTYNNEKVDPKKFKEEIKSKEDILNMVNLNDTEKNLIRTNILVPLSKANILAMHYQKGHFWSINLVYYFSAGAVAIVTLQLLLFPMIPQILFIEAGMMIAIILLYLWNKKEKWHRRWIDYRYLAERLRAATIFAISGLDCHISEHLPHQRLGDDWTLEAYYSIYQKQLEKPCKKLDFEQKREFVLKNWILDQQRYYIKKSAQHERTDNILNNIIYYSFGLTALLAIIHAMGVFWQTLEIPVISTITILLVIVLPAVAASCAGIKIQHEYLRISKRYSQMASYLKTVEYNIRKLSSDDEDKLVEILENANKMMLREHQDWRAIFSVRDAELP